jgi:hypothetical protein
MEVLVITIKGVYNSSIQQEIKNAVDKIENVERGIVVDHSIAIDCRNMETHVSIHWKPNLTAKILHMKQNATVNLDNELAHQSFTNEDFKGLPTLNDPFGVQSLVDESKSSTIKTKINEIN